MVPLAEIGMLRLSTAAQIHGNSVAAVLGASGELHLACVVALVESWTLVVALVLHTSLRSAFGTKRRCTKLERSRWPSPCLSVFSGALEAGG